MCKCVCVYVNVRVCVRVFVRGSFTFISDPSQVCTLSRNSGLPATIGARTSENMSPLEPQPRIRSKVQDSSRRLESPSKKWRVDFLIPMILREKEYE